jgi:hypothetical protein
VHTLHVDHETGDDSILSITIATCHSFDLLACFPIQLRRSKDLKCLRVFNSRSPSANVRSRVLVGSSSPGQKGRVRDLDRLYLHPAIRHRRGSPSARVEVARSLRVSRHC